jgi:hypothetical protein
LKGKASFDAFLKKGAIMYYDDEIYNYDQFGEESIPDFSELLATRLHNECQKVLDKGHDKDYLERWIGKWLPKIIAEVALKNYTPKNRRHVNRTEASLSIY